MIDRQLHSAVTQKDIARELGISHGSVSKALKNNPEIAPSTRERVQAVARKMGYQPNPMAAGLAEFKRNSKTIPVNAALAWINFWPDPRRLRSFKEFDRYWVGARACAEKCGYQLTEFSCAGNMTPKRLEKVLLARGIHGILLPPHEAAIEWADFAWENFSAVRFGRSLPAPRVHVVTADQVANGLIAYDAITARGYQRIGLVSQQLRCADPAKGQKSNHDRRWLVEAGFLMAQAETDPSQRVPVLFLDKHNLAKGQIDLEAWLKKHSPDAGITDNAELPSMLRKAGYRIPEDIGCAAISVLDGNADAGIYQNPEEVGRVAVLVLNSLLTDNARGEPAIFRQILVEGKWVDGSSLPRRN
jgi:DNA-binding LacI/PurR family transcriptional regulator